MESPGWLSQQHADVPTGDRWLGERERAVVAGLNTDRRRADWLLGRWTAKRALGAWLGVLPTHVEVLAAADGAPEAWLDGRRPPVSVSLSHRGGRAIAVVTDAPVVAGCDLELIEPRSDPFVRQWLARSEQRLVDGSDPSERPLLANLLWTAKEAASKVRRDGLRLAVQSAVVTLGEPSARNGAWRPLQVNWKDGPRTPGWWRAEPGWVMAVAGEPGTAPPRKLELKP